MNCAACQELLLDLVYGELDPLRAAEVELHLSTCADCKAELEKLRSTRATFAPLLSPELPGSIEEPSPAFDGPILAAARAAAATAAAAAVSANGPEKKTAQVIPLVAATARPRARWMRTAIAASVAAAAALALVVSAGHHPLPSMVAPDPESAGVATTTPAVQLLPKGQAAAAPAADVSGTPAPPGIAAHAFAEESPPAAPAKTEKKKLRMEEEQTEHEASRAATKESERGAAVGFARVGSENGPGSRDDSNGRGLAFSGAGGVALGISGSQGAAASQRAAPSPGGAVSLGGAAAQSEGLASGARAQDHVGGKSADKLALSLSEDSTAAAAEKDRAAREERREAAADKKRYAPPPPPPAEAQQPPAEEVTTVARNSLDGDGTVSYHLAKVAPPKAPAPEPVAQEPVAQDAPPAPAAAPLSPAPAAPVSAAPAPPPSALATVQASPPIAVRSAPPPAHSASVRAKAAKPETSDADAAEAGRERTASDAPAWEAKASADLAAQKLNAAARDFSQAARAWLAIAPDLAARDLAQAIDCYTQLGNLRAAQLLRAQLANIVPAQPGSLSQADESIQRAVSREKQNSADAVPSAAPP